MSVSILRYFLPWKWSFYILLLKQDRLTVCPEAYPCLSIAISKIHKDGGIGAFYAGMSPTLIGMLPYSTCYYFMYETMKKSYCKSKNKESLNRPELLVIGALAGKDFSLSYKYSVVWERMGLLNSQNLELINLF